MENDENKKDLEIELDLLNKYTHRETWQERAHKSLWTFLTIAAAIVFYYLMQYLGTISAFIGTVLSGISPVIWGLIFAYLLDPVAKFYERNITELFVRKEKATEKTPKRVRTVSAILTVLTAILFIVLLLLLIVPEVTNSVSGIVKVMPTQMERLMQQLKDKTFFDNESTVGAYANNALLSAMKSLEEWGTDLPKQMDTLAGYFVTGVKGAFSVIYNLAIGLILSLYITIDKEKLQRQVKKLMFSIMPEDNARRTSFAFKKANGKLSTAIRGKIVDSMIIGMIHFILLSFANLLPWFNYPYPVLLAVVVGLTNVVPFFGPLVGGFITGLLVLFEDPKMTIPYVIMVVILQQFDSNFLDPHIVGGSIGLRPFWSISACLLGSAVIGVPGFVLGPPTMSFIYEFVSNWTDTRIRERDLCEEFGVLPEEIAVEQQEAEDAKEIQPEARRLEHLVQSGMRKTAEALHKLKK